MKNKLYILLTFFTSLSFTLNAQINYLTANEFSKTKINNVNIIDISSTRGDVGEMQNLFSNSLTVKQGYSEALEFWIEFSTQSLSIKFYHGIQENSKILYDLGSIDILNSSSNIMLLEKTIKIGDDDSFLSNLNSRTFNNENIFTFTMHNIDEYIFIYVDNLSGKVIKIGYDGNLL
ncbi:exported hypothetical protein [Tenacibaculum sp. 190524A05c]|uniref:hypothetical protein n=1 Tax=Tenacibaculum platacis TaxID=3137852 RepID=UPI0031FB3EC3